MRMQMVPGTSPNYSIAKDDEATKTNAAAVSRPLLSGRI